MTELIEKKIVSGCKSKAYIVGMSCNGKQGNLVGYAMGMQYKKEFKNAEYAVNIQYDDGSTGSLSLPKELFDALQLGSELKITIEKI